jgi:serine/threonine protein kinase
LPEQRHKLEKVPTDLFRSIEARIARRDLNELDAGTTTIEFEPNVGSPPPRVITQRLVPDAPEIDAAADSLPSTGAEVGRVLRNRYVLQSRLGRGGMGTVFKALDRYRSDLPEGERHVAIKFLHEKTDGHGGIPSNLRREFHCAQALSHPNIVKVYELDLDGDAAFFTMEFLEGELLSDMIERLEPRAIARAFAWTTIQEVGAALAHAHSRNVTHGDLKPQNIMIMKSGEVRLLDFGASSALMRQLSPADSVHQTSATALTPAYASCELLEGRQPDSRDDLYALACLSYELLAGKHPFEQRRSLEARDRGLLAQRPPGLTDRQWATLAQGLAWNREDRSMAVRDWIAGLTAAPSTPAALIVPAAPPVPAAPAARAARATTPVTTAPPNSTPLLPTFSRRAALGVLSVAIFLGLGLWASFRGTSHDRQIGGNAGVTAPALSAAEDPTPSDSSSSAASDSPSAIPSPSSSAAPAAASPPVTQAATSRSGTADAAERRPKLPAAIHTQNASVIGISAEGYKIRRGQNFAEIHVHRSPGGERDTSFAWWTEPSTAKPGVDYAAQDRVTQMLPAGKHMASLFVRLIPNPARDRPAVFYVVIGEPGNGASLGRVTRTAVELPAK